MKRYLILPLLLALPCVVQAQEGEGKMGIAAVVNEQIISTLDVEDRVRLVIGTTGLKDTPEIQEKIRPQIVRSLIDETLQLQDAQRNGIAINEQELEGAVTMLEKQRGKPAGSLRAFLVDKQLPVPSFESQLKAQIAWSRLMVQRIRPKVRISNDEIERAKTKQITGEKIVEVQIAPMELPVDQPDRDESVRKLAEKLVGEIRGGASFEAVANQFSAEGGSINRNEPFWVDMTQVDPLIAAQLKNMKEGDITQPVRTVSGYQIVKLMARRVSDEEIPTADAEIAMKRIVLSLKPDAKSEEANLLLTVAQDIAKHPGTCEEKGVAGMTNPELVDIKVEFQRQKLSTLPAQVQTMLQRTEVGGTSEPVASPRGIELFMLCEKVDLPAPPSDRDEKIRQKIYQEKMALEAAKYMRNLRREAFVDIRL